MWHSVGKIQDVENGKSLILDLSGKRVALFKIEDQFYAIENTCPHRGGPLGEGEVGGMQVTCPWHAWTFDLKTGSCVNIPGNKIKTFPVKIEKEEILIEV